MKASLRAALLAALLFGAGFVYARYFQGPGPEQLERERREVERLTRELGDRLRVRARLPQRGESVVVGVPAGVAERLAGEALSALGTRIRLTLRGLAFRKSDDLHARLLGRRVVGRFSLDVAVHEVEALLRPGRPRLRFEEGRVGLTLPVAIEQGRGRARVRFRWDGRGVTGPVCGDFDVTRELSASVPRHLQQLEGALRVTLEGTTLEARPEFGDVELSVPIEPDREAWRLVDELIAGRGALCRAALGRADVPGRLRALLARGIRVTVPRRLFERTLRLPLGVDRSVEVGSRPAGLLARPAALELGAGQLWYGVDLELRPVGPSP
jgi:hypothetical protein